MTELYSERCTACRRDSPHVTDAEIVELHQAVSDWGLIDESGIPSWTGSSGFATSSRRWSSPTRWARWRRRKGNHPRLTTEWGRVGVTWWTHKIRNLHRNDFIMAAKTDRLYAEHAPADG